MDYATMAQTATTMLVTLWATPGVANVALGVTANGVYDLVKRVFTGKSVPAAVLEQTKTDPKNTRNQEDLKREIVRMLEDDKAFGEELAKLMPAQAMQAYNVTQRQKVGDNAVGVQNVSGKVTIQR